MSLPGLQAEAAPLGDESNAINQDLPALDMCLEPADEPSAAAEAGGESDLCACLLVNASCMSGSAPPVYGDGQTDGVYAADSEPHQDSSSHVAQEDANSGIVANLMDCVT